MKRLLIIFSLISALTLNFEAGAQQRSNDVFTPIGKYLAQGNTDALSAWFADNLQISVISQETSASKSQAKQILKAFFGNYTPRNFTITHTAGKSKIKYALGELIAGGERFHVTVFVICKDGDLKIQQLSITRA